MARRIERTQTKSKQKDMLNNVMAAINAAKVELANIQEATREQVKFLKNNSKTVLKLKSEIEIQLKKLKQCKTNKESAEEELVAMDKDLYAVLDKQREAKGLLVRTTDSLAAAVETFKQYVVSLNDKKETYSKIINDKLQKDEEEYLLKKKEIEEETDIEIERLNKMRALTNYQVGQMSIFNSQKEELKTETKELKKSFQLKQTAQRQLLKSEKDSILEKLEELNKVLTEATERNKIVSDDIEFGLKEQYSIINKTKEFKISLGMVEADYNEKKTKLKIELDKIQKEKEKEQETLNKIMSQKFGISKSKKELDILYAHIKTVYEQAGVPLPKLNIESNG